MAARPIEMSKVKQVIRMYESGVPKKEIARRLGICKRKITMQVFRKIRMHEKQKITM